ncbi:DUF305 domain-containing protein [Actinomadura craniellae]|nr:DUF305 domain-containing protein [Actinomadura craniellae]
MIAPGKPGEPNQTVLRGPSSEAPPTAADVRFVQMMIPHHEQALTMSALAPGQAADAKIKSLADRIDKTQTVEISAMQAWLKRRAPGPTQGGHGGHAGHGGGGATANPHANMPGMATEAQLAQLRAARGAEFDRLFLTLMITHHQGALKMARELLAATPGDQTVQTLAKDVLSSQNAEIGRMNALLSG